MRETLPNLDQTPIDALDAYVYGRCALCNDGTVGFAAPFLPQPDGEVLWVPLCNCCAREVRRTEGTDTYFLLTERMLTTLQQRADDWGALARTWAKLRKARHVR